MSSRTLALIASTTLSALSCGVFSMAPVEVPPATAPPPPLAAATAAPEPAPEAEPLDDDPTDAIREILARRRTGLTPVETDQVARSITEEARRNGLDPALLVAVMYVESRFNNFAVSPVGAMGLMQILPSTGEELAGRYGIPWHGPQTLFDPVVNVRLGSAYLRELSKRYGKLSTALAAYNWGPGRIDRRLQRGHRLPTEYPRLVLEAHEDHHQRVGRSS
jgi:soluble lytic murein transglycosylase